MSRFGTPQADIDPLTDALVGDWLAEKLRRLWRPDPLEDLQRLPQESLGLRGVPTTRAQRPRPASARASSHRLGLSCGDRHVTGAASTG